MKKILILGATGLIGSNVVNAFAESAEVIQASYSGSPYIVNITDIASLEALFKSVGMVDAIICTAGMVRFVPWAEATEGDWQHGLDNKLLGQVNVVRLGVSYVRPGGSITLTSGVLAQYPMPGSTIVTTVNAAIEAFVRAAAVELGDAVRINAVSPGWVSETMVAMGIDPSPGMPAAEVALHYVQQAIRGETGTINIAAKSAS